MCQLDFKINVAHINNQYLFDCLKFEKAFFKQSKQL